MSEIGQVRELNLSGRHYLQPCRYGSCTVGVRESGAGQTGQPDHSQLVVSLLPEGSVCLETNLAGCHSAS